MSSKSSDSYEDEFSTARGVFVGNFYGLAGGGLALEDEDTLSSMSVDLPTGFFSSCLCRH